MNIFCWLIAGLAIVVCIEIYIVFFSKKLPHNPELRADSDEHESNASPWLLMSGQHLKK